MNLINFFKKKPLYSFKKDSFLSIYKDILLLISGTVSSQIILLAVTPILTRLYDPSSFGILSIYMSSLLILGVGTTGKYELAISIPKDDKEGAALVHITLALNLLFTVLIIGLLYWAEPFLYYYLKISRVSKWIFFIPFSIFINAYITVFSHWNFRKNQSKINAYYIVFNAFVISALNIVFGYYPIAENGLIVSYVISQFFNVLFFLYFFYKYRHHIPLINLTSFVNLKKIVKDYIDFPKFMLPSELLVNITGQVTPILLSFFFGSAVVGQFMLATRIIRVPLIVFSNSVGNIFKNTAIDEFREKNNCRELYLALLKKLIILSIVPFILLAFTAPYLFTFLLGINWCEAGKYAQILSISLFFELIALPFSTIFHITQGQKINFILQLINLVLVVSSIWLGSNLFKDTWHTMLLYAITNGVFYIIMSFIIYRLTTGKRLLFNYSK